MDKGGGNSGGGFEPMEAYIQRRQNTVAQTFATRSLLYLFEVEGRKQGARVEMWWWKQAVIDLSGATEMAAAAEAVEPAQFNKDDMDK